MEGYLGEFPVDVADSPFKDFTPSDWALEYISRYGGREGNYHKAWVIDQVARILHGTSIKLIEARWLPNKQYPEGLTEYRFSTEEPPARYNEWVADICDGEDGPNTYSYDVGVSP